jgi:hypothetical protein
MVLTTNAEPKTVLDCLTRTLKKVLKMVPKSRTIKSSRPSLEPFIVLYDTFFYSVTRPMIVELLQDLSQIYNFQIVGTMYIDKEQITFSFFYRLIWILKRL